MPAIEVTDGISFSRQKLTEGNEVNEEGALFPGRKFTQET